MTTARKGLRTRLTRLLTPATQTALGNAQILCHLCHRLATGLCQLDGFSLKLFGGRSLPVLHEGYAFFGSSLFTLHPLQKRDNYTLIWEEEHQQYQLYTHGQPQQRFHRDDEAAFSHWVVRHSSFAF